jgi:hypothetical protein
MSGIEAEQRGTGPPQNIDALIVRDIARWAVVVALLLLAYDLAILANYPFPGSIDGLRGPFYVLVAVVLLAATGFITFIGYRFITMRVVTRVPVLVLIYLPAVVLVSSIIGFLLLTVPR